MLRNFLFPRRWAFALDPRWNTWHGLSPGIVGWCKASGPRTQKSHCQASRLLNSSGRLAMGTCKSSAAITAQSTSTVYPRPGAVPAQPGVLQAAGRCSVQIYVRTSIMECGRPLFHGSAIVPRGRPVGGHWEETVPRISRYAWIVLGRHGNARSIRIMNPGASPSWNY